jgi:hypothetical protein
VQSFLPRKVPQLVRVWCYLSHNFCVNFPKMVDKQNRRQPFDPRRDNAQSYNRNQGLDDDYEDSLGKSQLPIPTLLAMDWN